MDLNEVFTILKSAGLESIRETIVNMLDEEYNRGRSESCSEQIDLALDCVYTNAMREINIRRSKLLEDNFYNKPSTDAEIEMKAYDLIKEILPEMIKSCKPNLYKNSQ